MQREEFIDNLKADFEKGFSARYGPVVMEEDLYRTALELAREEDPRVVFRASYALEWAFFKDPGRFAPHIPLLIENYLTVCNRSAQRHYIKMLDYILRHDMIRLSPEQEEQLAERTFDLLIDPQTPVAIKVWAMEILYRFSGTLPWVGEHLYETITHLMASGTPGILSRGSKIRLRLRENEQLNKKD